VAIRVHVLLLALAACSSPTPLVGDVTSDGGTWGLALAETSYDRGAAELRVTVTPIDPDAAVERLTLFLQADMEGMGHAGQLVDLYEADTGAYAGAVTFDMAGIWTLAGYVGDDAGVEGFAFVVEVRP
jgi:hypothetical protein